MLRLIADSGSTKTSWCLTGTDVPVVLKTMGLNPYFLSEEEIISEIEDTLKSRLNQDPDEINFYGAGCGSPEKRKIIEKALQHCFPNSHIIVETDMLGAARALCGNNAGIAGILGTGANSCFYDGKEIKANTPSLGYILGDEGSGAYLGKQLLKHYVYSELPEALHQAFTDEYGLDRDHIIESVYRKPLPNRFLASFVPFLKKNEQDPFINKLVYEAFSSFITHHIKKYGHFGTDKLNATGSVAYYFSSILQKAAVDNNFKIGNVQQSPMEGLIKYHG